MVRGAGVRFHWKGGLFLIGGLLLGVLLGALVFLNGPDVFGASPRQLPPTVGSPAPEFYLGQLGATKVGLSDFRGKPVILNFWATWCLPCKEEMPLLDQTFTQYSDRLMVLGINAGESPNLVDGYVKETGITFPILLDSNEKVTDRYFVRNFPMTFFIDADGVIRAQHIGQLQENILVRYLSAIGIEP